MSTKRASTRQAEAPAPRSSPNPDGPSTLHLDAAAIKVLAHPLRSRLLSALRAGGPATATVLADHFGTNSGATSYHLRKLASVGLVEETGEGHGRERWWRAATEMHSFTQRDVAGDPDAEAATDWLRRYYLRSLVERYEHWLDIQETWPLEWREAADASDRLVHVSPARLAQLQAELAAIIARYVDAEPSDPDPRPVEVHVYAFPIPEIKR
jgi:DNA-binding transcriptional ArsR family regulator